MADYEAHLLHRRDGSDKLAIYWLDGPYKQTRLRHIIETTPDTPEIGRFAVASIVLALCPSMENVEVCEWYWDEDYPVNRGDCTRFGDQVWQ